MLSAALAGLGVDMSEWLPIETAPKDGTEILLVRFQELCMPALGGAYWGRRDGFDDEEGWVSRNGAMWFPLHPTHWIPLPEPPK